MGENRLLRIADFDQLDIPVDIQVARFTLYTGVLRILSENFEGCVHKNPLRPMIEEVWRDVARERSERLHGNWMNLSGPLDPSYAQNGHAAKAQ